MPRDPNRPFRLPSVTAKVHQIKGFSPAEKALFTRVANLIDTFVITQRAENNPGGVPGRKVSERVPIPAALETAIVTGGITIQWEPVEFNNFFVYELQYDNTSSFAAPITLEVSTTQITIKDEFSDTLFVRVRTVSRTGEVSEFSSTVSINVVNTIYTMDFDAIEPENRTNVETRPKLLGSQISTNPGDLAFVGVGGAVGPGAQGFSDTSVAANLKIRNQITYTLREANILGGKRTMVMPNGIVEVEQFYTILPQFYIQTLPLTGSFVDFFDNYTFQSSLTSIDVEFLRYFNFYGHHQSGMILNATDHVLKH
jgi:hypothetical protein